jgi:hypothetical protein
MKLSLADLVMGSIGKACVDHKTFLWEGPERWKKKQKNWPFSFQREILVKFGPRWQIFHMKERNDMIFVLCVKSDKCLTKFDLTFSPENFRKVLWSTQAFPILPITKSASGWFKEIHKKLNEHTSNYLPVEKVNFL